jgi:ribA/ribD-fused uncharacterized protein
MTLKDTQDQFVLFWKGMLSQWHPSPFTDGRDTYPTAEHWMMAEKARLFGDLEAAEEIMATDSPEQAKKIGRRVKNFDVSDWKLECFQIVVVGNRLKFEQNEKEREYLLSTGNKILVEASPYDQIWGVGMDEKCMLSRNPACWKGQNLLGMALMVVRATLLDRVSRPCDECDGEGVVALGSGAQTYFGPCPECNADE